MFIIGYTTQNLQIQLVELKGPLKFKWKLGKDMPFDMTHHIQAVVIGDNVYFGGGYTIKSYNMGFVLVYELCTGLWTTLPCYKNWTFGMASMNNQLVLVGGKSISTERDTNILGAWDEESQTWTHPFPDLPTPRNESSVISYKK